MKIIILLILILLTASYSYNHPEIDWKTVTSKNYKIIYNESTEPALYASWKIAEEAYERYKRLYKYPEGKRINLILADEDDYSNGLASWTDHTIKIWIPDSHFDLRDMNVWLRDVIYHEVAHIMSMEKNKRLLYWTFGGAYHSEDLNVNYLEPIATMAFMPMWFVEGTAQLRSEEMGGDCRDSRREMILRDAALNDRLLSLDEMGHFSHNMIGNELVYNQGYAFTKYLEENFGKKGISSIWNKYKKKKIAGRNFSKIFYNTFKKSLESEYLNWKDELVESFKGNDSLDNSEVFWQKGHINKSPQINSIGDKIGFLSSTKDDFGRTDLVIVSKDNKKVLQNISYVKSDWKFSKNGERIYYIKSRKPNSSGSFFNDLFYMDLKNEKEVRITNSARIYNFDIDEKDENVYAVSYKKSKFELIKIDLQNSKVSCLNSPNVSEGFLSVVCKDSSLVVTKLLHGKAAIYKYDINSNTLDPVLENNAHEENAFLGADNRIYYTADYDGVHNIYSVNKKGQDMLRHTSVSSGAITPFYDGKKIWFSKYENQKYSIYNIDKNGTSYSIKELPDCKYTDIPKPQGNVNISASDYVPKTGRALLSGFSFITLSDYDDALQDMVLNRDTDSIWQIGLEIFLGLNMQKSDPLEKRIVYGGVGIAVGNLFTDTVENNDSIDNRFNFKNRYPNFNSKKSLKKSSVVINSFNNNMGTVQSDDEDSSEAGTFPGYFVAAPFWGIESRSYKPTLGINVEMQIISMVPYGIYSYPFVSYQIARDIHVGLSPMLSFYPILLRSSSTSEGAFAADFSFWLNWTHTNYINEDIQYNLGGVSFVELSIGPQISPQIEEIDDEESVESSATLKIEFNAMHYFPLFKYGSLSIGGSFQSILSNREMNSTTGVWTNDNITSQIDSVESNTIIGGIIRSDLTFPFIRNINRGPFYFDNLYGGIHYSTTAIAAGKFLKQSDRDLIFDKNYSNQNAYCDHKIGVSVSLGFIKDYVFNRRLQLMLYRNLFKEETGVELQISF